MSDDVDVDVLSTDSSLPLPSTPHLDTSSSSSIPAADDVASSLSVRERILNTPDLFVVFLYFVNFIAGVAFGYGVALATFLYLPLQIYIGTMWPMTSIASVSNTNNSTLAETDDTTTAMYSHLFTSLLFCFIGVGAFLVNLFFGQILDRLGRRISVLFLIGFALFATIGLCSSVYYPMLAFFLAAYGLYLGAESNLFPLYIAENCPSRHEKTVGVVFQIGAGTGMVFVNVINIVIEDLPHTWNWRLGLSVQFVFCVMFFVVFLLMPESPAWKEAKQLRKERERELARRKMVRFLGTGKGTKPSVKTNNITNELGLALDDDFDVMDVLDERDRDTILEEDQRREEEVQRLREARDRLANQNGCEELCCETEYIRSFWVGILLTVAMKLTGIDIIGSFTPVLFVQANFDHSSANFYSLLFTLFNVCTTFVPLILINRIGRKILILIGLCLMIISLITVGIIFQALEDHMVVKAAIGIVAFVFFLFGFNIGIGATYFQALHVMKFPTSVRPHLGSFFVFVFYFFQCCVFATFTPLSELLHVSYGFYFFAIVGVVAGIGLLVLMKLHYSGDHENEKDGHQRLEEEEEVEGEELGELMLESEEEEEEEVRSVASSDDGGDLQIDDVDRVEV